MAPVPGSDDGSPNRQRLSQNKPQSLDGARQDEEAGRADAFCDGVLGEIAPEPDHSRES